MFYTFFFKIIIQSAVIRGRERPAQRGDLGKVEVEASQELRLLHVATIEEAAGGGRVLDELVQSGSQ